MVVKDRGPKYFGRKPLEMGINWKFSWTAQPFGSKRRQDILDYLRSIKDEDRNYILINRRYCLNLQRDPDLRRLLKQGKVKMIKVPAGGKASYSALVINEGQ